MTGDVTWQFTTEVEPDLIPPSITSTDPADGATDVPLDTDIRVTFSEAIDRNTVNGSSFFLEQGGTSVPGTIGFSGNSAILDPSSDLMLGVTYTATVTTAVLDLAGNSLTSNVSWSFTMEQEAIPPTVVSTDPFTDEGNVAVGTTVVITFSEPIDSTTFNSTTFILEQSGSQVVGNYSVNGSQATFTPSNDLVFGEIYNATITTGIQDLVGNTLQSEYSWSFVTEFVPPISGSLN